MLPDLASAPPMTGTPPVLPGITTTAAPSSGPDLLRMLMAKMQGQQAPTSYGESSGNLIAQAVDALRKAASHDPRVAPLVKDAIQMLVMGGPAAPPMGGPGMGPAGIMSPVGQQAPLAGTPALANLRG